MSENEWRHEYRIPGKSWVNAADMTGDDHCAVAAMYEARARGEAVAPFYRERQP